MSASETRGQRDTLPIPNGWYAVAVSTALKPGDLERVHYFGQELVVFRTESGVAAVFDAYCPHLGAHLGYGGRIEGEQLRCPFHGWAFGADGTCEAIPYAKRIPNNASAGKLPTLERNGFIFAWWDPSGRDPWYDVPEVAETTDVSRSSPDW